MEQDDQRVRIASTAERYKGKLGFSERVSCDSPKALDPLALAIALSHHLMRCGDCHPRRCDPEILRQHAMMRHDHLTGATGILAQIVVNDEGEIAFGKQGPIVGVEIVGGKDVDRTLLLREGFQYRVVAAADRIDRADVGIGDERRPDQPFRRTIDTKAF